MAANIGALYEQYHRMVWATAFHLTRHPDDADDLAQDVWLRAVQSGVTPDNPRAWLLHIVRNLAIDRYRKRASCNRRVMLCELDACGGEPDPLSDTATAAISHVELTRALNWLTAPQGDTLALFVAGYGAEEVAAMTGNTYNGCKSILHRARVTVRRTLERG